MSTVPASPLRAGARSAYSPVQAMAGPESVLTVAAELEPISQPPVPAADLEPVWRPPMSVKPEPLLILPAVEAVWSRVAPPAQTWSASGVAVGMGLRLDAMLRAAAGWAGSGWAERAGHGVAERTCRPGRARPSHGLAVREPRWLGILATRAPPAGPERPCWSWSGEAPSDPSPPQGLARNHWTGERRGIATRQELGPPSPRSAHAAVDP
jgi:hypothetical protein